ncbi:MAG: nucleoside kinase [Candidatus Enteromonas sp.]|nr:nucleoside kinase [Candidatus Enteromonas sp.]MDY6093662.1 nucleoside kinase [Candidatus Enteromonas sp.]
MKFTVTAFGETKTYDRKVSLLEILGDRDPEKKILACRVNNRIRSLTYELHQDSNLVFITCRDPEAMKIYEATLRFIVAMAFHRAYPDQKIRFSYDISRTVSIHLIEPHVSATTAMLLRVKHEIAKITEADYPLERCTVSVEEAKEIFEKNGYLDKLDILSFRPEKTVHLYRCDGYVDYMYSHMTPSTGYIKDFKIRLYAPGLLLQYPRSETKGTIPEFEDAPTFNRTLKESHDWAKIVHSSNVSGINRMIQALGPIDYINLCEARHNRMLTELGELICDDIDQIRLICIAGPSSSGKTTFANRLRIELMSRGLHPIRLSIDDYYRPKSEMPIDEDGNPDYESIECLDIPLFNQNMLELISGQEVTLPKFDFQLGHRVEGRTLKIGPGQPIIIEGIHALNDALHMDIPKSAKFKIFIAPQAQINLDDHNPLSLTDLRLIRRIVRDYQFRNSPAEETLHMWPSVRAGEFKWIYPYQEGCDYVFNSMLSYELPVLKKYAVPLLKKIQPESDVYPMVLRLLRMLKFFVDIDDSVIPNNSLMREFIGGSVYADV